MHDYGMSFCYNYFEDDCWGNAGFNLGNGYVWSNKIGWNAFWQDAYGLFGYYGVRSVLSGTDAVDRKLDDLSALVEVDKSEGEIYLPGKG